jgi:hypothetical protein
VIDWWREVSLKNITIIDLRQNSLTGEGLMKIVTWLISCPSSDYQREALTSPLVIDLQNNLVIINIYFIYNLISLLWTYNPQIPKSQVVEALILLRNSLEAELTLVGTENEGDVIFMYVKPENMDCASPSSSNSSSSTSGLFCKMDLRFQRGKQNIKLEIQDPPRLKIPTAISEDRVDRKSDWLINPRDDIINNIVM